MAEPGEQPQPTNLQHSERTPEFVFEDNPHSYDSSLFKSVCLQPSAFRQEMPETLRAYIGTPVPRSVNQDNNEYYQRVHDQINNFMLRGRLVMAWGVAHQFAKDRSVPVEPIISSINQEDPAVAPEEWRHFLDFEDIPREYAVGAIKRLIAEYNGVLIAAGSKNNRMNDPLLYEQVAQARMNMVDTFLPDVTDEEAHKLFHMNMSAEKIHKIASGEIKETF